MAQPFSSISFLTRKNMNLLEQQVRELELKVKFLKVVCLVLFLTTTVFLVGWIDLLNFINHI
jgi:hypothetical protein